MIGPGAIRRSLAVILDFDGYSEFNSLHSSKQNEHLSKHCDPLYQGGR